MKKLVIILLSGIYALSVFGVAPAAFYCCEKAAFAETLATHSASDAADNGCKDQDNGFISAVHHTAAATVHHFFRHLTLQPHTGIVTAGSTFPQQGGASGIVYKKIANPYSSYIPLYRLHCVYRI